MGPDKERICDRSEQDKSELLEEQQIVINLCKANLNGAQTHSEKIRLQALKTVQKKIKFSIERYDLEWQKNYRLSLFIINLFLLYIAFVKYMSSPFAVDLIKELNLNDSYYLVVGGFFFILIKTIFEYGGKSIAVMLKRRLELVEQAIELAETDERTNA
jgi:hypothetical protein